METERGTTQEFNRFPFVRDLHEIQPVFPEADFGLGITSGLPVTHQQSEIWNPSTHSMGVLAICESSKATFCDFAVGAHADIPTWREQPCVDVIPNKTVQRSEQLGLIPKPASLQQSRRSEP
jgi:hypothetical protein